MLLTYVPDMINVLKDYAKNYIQINYNKLLHNNQLLIFNKLNKISL